MTSGPGDDSRLYPHGFYCFLRFFLDFVSKESDNFKIIKSSAENVELIANQQRTDDR